MKRGIPITRRYKPWKFWNIEESGSMGGIVAAGVIMLAILVALGVFS